MQVNIKGGSYHAISSLNKLEKGGDYEFGNLADLYRGLHRNLADTWAFCFYGYRAFPFARAEGCNVLRVG